MRRKGEAMIHLTERLQTAADLVPPCRVMADIGTDHGYVPIYLCQTGKITGAVASDIHDGPAERARVHIGEEGLSRQISVRVGPGLSTLAAGEAEGAVIAGMGGLMILRILEEGRPVASRMDWFVLQPQNHGKELRRWLGTHGFTIEKEKLAREDRRMYQVLLVRHGVMAPLSPIEEETGAFLLRKGDPLIPDFLRGLIRKREWTIDGVAEDTDNEKNAEKRRCAVKEKEELEALLWKYTEET